MASKYLNLEEAAAQLSITPGELNRLRESQKIRAFADRGTWKFKAEDVETLSRTLGADSVFDIPGMDDDDVIAFEDDIDIAGGSQIVLAEEVGDQPTVISKKTPYSPPNSDSDVRLFVDPSLESDSPVPPAPPKTLADSGITQQNPVGSQTPLRADSEDDSKLSLKETEDEWASISDSDVRLAPLDLEDAGSDITLAAESNIIKSSAADSGSHDTDASDSDVTLIGGGMFSSDIGLAADDSSARLLDEKPGSDSVLDLDDISDGPGSGLIYSGDSGISLDLAIDSGISLGGNDDDSITLGADSGISLVPDSGIGLTLDDSYQLQTTDESTIPMLGGMDDDDDNDTSFDMPLLSGDSSDEIKSSSVGETTNVVMFDDDDEASDTMEFDSAELGEDEFVNFDDDDDDSYDQLSDDELDVDSDMLDDDVLEADDEAFEDDFESGESVSALAVPGTARGGAALAAIPSEWDTLSFSLVLVSTLLMGVCTLLMYDLVRSMWGYETPINVNGMILDALQGLIKS